jgi:hypothetical protein
MKRSSFEWLLRALTIGSWTWLLFSRHEHPTQSLCLIKNLSGYPCPACGTTRSVLLILDGHFWQSSLLNPLGWFALVGLSLTTLFLLIDWLMSLRTTEALFFRMEEVFKAKPLLQVFFLLCIILNWIWNIQKQL